MSLAFEDFQPIRLPPLTAKTKNRLYPSRVFLCCKRSHTKGRSAAPQPFNGSSGASRNPLVMKAAVPLILFFRSRSNGQLVRPVGTRCFKYPNSSQQTTFQYEHPLPLAEKGAQVFREIKGHCPNCHSTDPSFRTCPAPFTNSSHLSQPRVRPTW